MKRRLTFLKRQLPGLRHWRSAAMWNVRAAFLVSGLLFSSVSVPAAIAQQAAVRSDLGLLVLYDFSEGDGETIHDRSGAREPLNLTIEKPAAIRWRQGALVVRSPTLIASTQPATKVIEAIRKSSAITIEAWLKPENLTQGGPARVVSLSANTSQRNFTLGQDKDVFDVRLRTTGSDNNGLPSTSTPAQALPARMMCVVFTRDADGSAHLFIDGQKVTSNTVKGAFSNWDTNHRLTLVNEVTGDRPWLGELYQVAIYDRALSGQEIQETFAPEKTRLSLAIPPDFQSDVHPLLIANCIRCHGPEKQKGGLRLDQKMSALKGGDSGEAGIVPGDASKSRLLQLVTATDNAERMPPEGEPLTQEQIELLRRWINSGANWPDAETSPQTAVRKEMVVTDDDRKHWSFRPLQNISPPTPVNQTWIRTPVDQFIRQAQETSQLTPADPADALTLIRRVFFDLIGLPPILKEEGSRLKEETLGIEMDLAEIQGTPDAFSSLVDQLLASPHYGERWARHWLDVARYADSDGQEGDADRPNAYRFRDFVIQSLNEDLPYDTFVRWQLAGDEIAPDNPLAIAATGFIVAGNSTVLNVPMEEEKLRNRANELDDMVSTTAQAFLGLTLGCARCHDHKYDPLPTRDYYRMMCAFNGGDRRDVPLAAPAAVKARRDEIDAWQKDLNAAEKKRNDWLDTARKPIAGQVLIARVSALPVSDEEKKLVLDKPDDPAAKKLSNRFKKELKIQDHEYVAALPEEQQSQWRELDAAVKEVAGRKPEDLPTAFAFADYSPDPPETWLFERGDFMARNERLSLGFLTVMLREKSAGDYWTMARVSRLRDDSSQQRRAMADWITDTQHGAGVLLARVMVNRIWQHHFGDGLVRTVSDFGARGELPTHPELLEWLTGEFIRSGWNIKHLHRLILNSATWRQGTAPSPVNAAIDPDNRMIWRRRPLRLESEAMRDAMLAVAGSLNSEMFGPGFKPPIPAEAMQARNVKNPYPRDVKESDATRRRSIYMFHKRVVQYPLMLAFDAPDAQVSCGRRINTTVAPQALALLNDPFVRLRSAELAQRLHADAGKDSDSQIRLAFQRGLARPPSDEELTDARSFLEDQSKARKHRDPNTTDDAAQMLALTDFCQMLFSLNEFIYVD